MGAGNGLGYGLDDGRGIEHGYESESKYGVFCADGYTREDSKADERERGGSLEKRKGRDVLQEPRAREEGYRFEEKRKGGGGGGKVY